MQQKKGYGKKDLKRFNKKIQDQKRKLIKKNKFILYIQ